MAEVLVVRATGPSAKKFPAGKALADNARITLAANDSIVVLDGSRVAEAGSHEELLARGGHYAELYRLQAAAYR